MAIVYCIVCNITGEKYYGSTKQPLSKRLQEHKKLLCTSKQIILRGDYDIYQLIHCETKEEAELKEDWYIRNKECVNKMRVKVTDEERKETKKKYYEKNREKKKEQKKEYYKKNIEKFKENSKEWRKENIEKIKEYSKEYYKKNREKQKEYREKNREKIRENKKKKVECEFCGLSLTKGCLKRHQRTQLCLTNKKN